MSRMSQRKGKRIEREIVKAHEAVGIAALCMGPIQAGTGRREDVPDVRIAGEFGAEVKARATGGGFTTIEKWLGSQDLLFLRRDNAPPLVVMDWRTYELLMTSYVELREG